MDLSSTRACPICNGSAKKRVFPYATVFAGSHFNYLLCGGCSSVFVDPIPDQVIFASMYAKADYHDCHYQDKANDDYTASAAILRRFVAAGSRVLDYGCGTGAFLQALRGSGLIAVGVEFDNDAACFAAQQSSCETLSVDQFRQKHDMLLFDAIHLGDVLEHLPEPAATLRTLLALLKPGGMLFVQGPLEVNPSPVYWFARLFGAIKRRARPEFLSNHKPTHLFRTGARQQLDFFFWVDPNLSLRFWRIYESGWPYAQGGLLKRIIARIAVRLGGKQLFSMTFGNRFVGVFQYCPVQDASN